eukprot:scaffold10121_cov112-Isochrysis_galbana.AAC.9
MEGVKEPEGNRFRYTSKGLIPRLFEGIFSEFGNDEKVHHPLLLLFLLSLPHPAGSPARPFYTAISGLAFGASSR